MRLEQLELMLKALGRFQEDCPSIQNRSKAGLRRQNRLEELAGFHRCRLEDWVDFRRYFHSVELEGFRPNHRPEERVGFLRHLEADKGLVGQSHACEVDALA